MSPVWPIVYGYHQFHQYSPKTFCLNDLYDSSATIAASDNPGLRVFVSFLLTCDKSAFISIALVIAVNSLQASFSRQFSKLRSSSSFPLRLPKSVSNKSVWLFNEITLVVEFERTNRIQTSGPRFQSTILLRVRKAKI